MFLSLAVAKLPTAQRAHARRLGWREPWSCVWRCWHHSPGLRA
ncbi:hypothetical protein ACLK1V_15440 [Escherichia coli]